VHEEWAFLCVCAEQEPIPVVTHRVLWLCLTCSLLQGVAMYVKPEDICILFQCRAVPLLCFQVARPWPSVFISLVCLRRKPDSLLHLYSSIVGDKLTCAVLYTLQLTATLSWRLGGLLLDHLANLEIAGSNPAAFPATVVTHFGKMRVDSEQKKICHALPHRHDFPLGACCSPAQKCKRPTNLPHLPKAWRHLSHAVRLQTSHYRL